MVAYLMPRGLTRAIREEDLEVSRIQCKRLDECAQIQDRVRLQTMKIKSNAMRLTSVYQYNSQFNAQSNRQRLVRVQRRG